MKKYFLSGLLIAALISACGKPTSPQAKAFLDMRASICKGGSLAAAKPYVTESSKVFLDISDALMPMAQMMQGQAMNDALAKDCQKPPNITNEVKVNNQRYLIQYVDLTGQKEIAVVLENGQWKVQLSGK
jgi:hypothetical protein